MRSIVMALMLACLSSTLLSGNRMACGQSRPDGAAIEMQKAKLTALSAMDGTWRGTAWMITESGERIDMTQTERVGPMLDGAIKTVEGRGYNSKDEVVFHAFAVIAFDAAKNQVAMRSYAQGRQGDFVVNITGDGFTWEIPAGPAKIRYTAVVKDGNWHEVGERLIPGRDPMRFFEMTLKRVGDTTWPAEGAIAPR